MKFLVQRNKWIFNSVCGFTALLLMVILPVSAAAYTVAPIIDRGAIIHIGEESLNLTHALNRAGGLEGNAVDREVPTNWTIGWWVSAADMAHTTSSKTLNISTRYQNFTVTKEDFVGYTGYWYLEDPDRPREALLDPDGLPRVVFNVNDPYLDIHIRDVDGDRDVTGKSATRGVSLGFRIDTNMYGALNSNYRSPVSQTTGDGYIDIKVRNESGILFTRLSDSSNTPHDLLRQNVTTSPWTWGDPENPASPHPWATGVEDTGGQPLYPVGTYIVAAESLLNNMKANYRQGGADYTGKTVSQTCTITLISDSLSIESDRDSVARGERFSVTLSGKPGAAYFLWVNNTGTMTGAPGDQPPTILVSAPVSQDPYEGPFTIGGHSILGAGGKTISEDVPPSAFNVSHNEYYAKLVTSPYTTTVEFRTSPETKPGTYAIRAENDALSDEVLIEVVPEIVAGTAVPDTEGRVIYRPLINPDGGVVVNNDLKRVSRGGTVFIGEEGLNVSEALAEADALAVPAPSPDGSHVGWWAWEAWIRDSSPSKTIDLAGRESSLKVSPGDFVGYTGGWYLVNPSTGMAAFDASGSPVLVFSVEDPFIMLRIRDTDTNGDVTGKSVPQGERLTFQVDTNMYQAFDTPYRPDLTGSTPGIITITVKNERNARYTYLFQNNTTAISLLDLKVDGEPWFWGGGMSGLLGSGYWDTGLLDRDGYYFYPAGTYTVCAESTLNKMKDNYKQGGADYTGKTVSPWNTITIVNDMVKIEANRDSVVGGKPFSVTVSGRPAREYYLWVGGTHAMAGGYGDQAPLMILNQEGVTFDPAAGPYPIGSFMSRTDGGKTIRDDVSLSPENGTRNYARIKTSVSGIRTVEFATTNWTKQQNFTIRVEQNFTGLVQRDEVNMSVVKGEVAIVAAGDQRYSLGEEIRFSGTNTETYKTYLFMVGPNLPGNGANIAMDDPQHWPTENNVVNTFKAIDVSGDNTWSWKWGTANHTLDAGTYTIYAVSRPCDREHLEEAAYGSVSIIIEASGRIAIYQEGSWYIDMNGDGVWDDGDRNYGFGAPDWTPVSGDWNNDGLTEIGVYRDGAWYLDYDATGSWSAGDRNFGYGAQDWLPVVGDWNGDGFDTIGVYKDGAWYLDYDGSGTWTAGDKNYAFGGAGWTPVVGKWTDGMTKIGVYKDGIYYIDYTGDGVFGAGDTTFIYGSTGSTAITGDWNANALTEVGTKTGSTWQLDYDGLGTIDANTKSATFGSPAWDPVIGDWNADGKDNIGIYLNGAWYLDQNGNGAWDAGTDKNYAFGTTGWIPIVGKWS